MDGEKAGDGGPGKNQGRQVKTKKGMGGREKRNKEKIKVDLITDPHLGLWGGTQLCSNKKGRSFKKGERNDFVTQK